MYNDVGYNKKIKMQKNLILTMLACLNCVHTTHAVESTSAGTQIRESLDKLKEQYRLQDLRMTADRTLIRDAAIKKEKIRQKAYALLKNELPSDDPRRSWHDSLINISREVVEELSNPQPDNRERIAASHLFNKKIEEYVKSGKITWLKVDHPEEHLAHEMALHDVIPGLSWTGPCRTLSGQDLSNICLENVFSPGNPPNTKERIIRAHAEIQALANKYPDIAKKRRALYRKLWADSINSGIKNGAPWIDNIVPGLQQLDDSKTETGKDMKETILHTLHDALIGKDQDLAEKTERVLEDTPVLGQIENKIGRMSLVKTMKNKEQAKAPLKNVDKNVFREVGKYLGTQDRSNKPILRKRTRSDREVDHGPAKRQRTD